MTTRKSIFEEAIEKFDRSRVEDIVRAERDRPVAAIDAANAIRIGELACELRIPPQDVDYDAEGGIALGWGWSWSGRNRATIECRSSGSVIVVFDSTKMKPVTRSVDSTSDLVFTLYAIAAFVGGP